MVFPVIYMKCKLTCFSLSDAVVEGFSAGNTIQAVTGC